MFSDGCLILQIDIFLVSGHSFCDGFSWQFLTFMFTKVHQQGPNRRYHDYCFSLYPYTYFEKEWNMHILVCEVGTWYHGHHTYSNIAKASYTCRWKSSSTNLWMGYNFFSLVDIIFISLVAFVNYYFIIMSVFAFKSLKVLICYFKLLSRIILIFHFCMDFIVIFPSL